MEVNMYTEELLNKILEKAIDYYQKGIKEGIDLTRKKYSELDKDHKKFNFVIEFADSVGYDYTNDFKIH